MQADPLQDNVRLFIGLPVPLDIGRRLQSGRKPLPGALWVAVPDLHLTLRYLGDVERSRLDEIDAMLARVRKKSFSLVLAGMGIFAQPGEEVLYARVENTRHVTDLCARVTDLMVDLGFDFGTRPFVPHVTLARVRGGRATDYAEKYGKTIKYQWYADRFMLYQSGGIARKEGGAYRVRSVYELKN